MAAESIWNGEYYAHHSDIQEEWRKDLIRDLTFRGDETLLDIGCGDGRLTAQLSPRLPRGQIVGIDASFSMISWAKVTHTPHPRLTFEVKDALDMTYNNAFNCILSSNALHWVPDHRTVLKNIARALKPSGHFHLLFCALSDIFHPIRFAIKGAMEAHPWKPYFIGYKTPSYSFRRKDYIHFALEAGIPHFTITDIHSVTPFPSLSAFVDWIMGWLHGLELLPSALHRLFAEEVAVRYAQYPDTTTPSGSLLFAQKLWLINGSL